MLNRKCGTYQLNKNNTNLTWQRVSKTTLSEISFWLTTRKFSNKVFGKKYLMVASKREALVFTKIIQISIKESLTNVSIIVVETTAFNGKCFSGDCDHRFQNWENKMKNDPWF